MELKNDLHVISLTHWDREWRFPFARTRMLLVEMMDELLATLERDPDYKCFHLDGQTILLDDYFEVRPENVERFRKYVEAGRVQIGPWYVLPEENQMSGESLVRNFLWGERLGRKYGGNMKVGYSPTSWGQVSQMPQIMSGFGIESIIFYRGISSDQVRGNYYRWIGPDGSELFAVRLGDYARSGFFHLVDRAVCFNRGTGDQSHDWALGGKPFRVCGSGSATPYHFYHPPMGWYPQRIEEALTLLEDVDLGKWKTPFALAFECDDSTGPFIMTPRIIAEANKLVTNGKRITHGNLPDSIRAAREALGDEELEVMRGEMRNPQRAGLWTDLYAEIQAERMPTKYANRRAEFALQRTAEPMATLAWMLGEPYPRWHLDQANSFLLQCHAHDSIGCCGRDQVDADVRYRLGQVQIIAGAIGEDAAREIAGRIDTSQFDPSEILLVVFNPLPRTRSEVVTAEIDIAQDRRVLGFTVEDVGNSEVAVQITGKSAFLAVFNHPHELPLRTWCDRWEFRFRADNVPAMGYKVFRVRCAAGEMRHPGTMLTGPTSMANDILAVHVNPNGTVDVTSKADGRVLAGCNLFEDRGEVGDYWIGAFPLRDRIITSHGCNARIAVVEDGPLAAAIEAELTVDLPVAATQDSVGRTEETRPVTITTVYRLVAGEPFLRITTTIENTVRDHILRSLFPTNVQTNVAHAEAPFDVVERAIPLPDTRNWREPYKPVQPQQNFVDLSDGTVGVAVLNRGLPQYEAVDDPRRTIALTLLRCNRSWNSVRLAHYPDQIGSQCLGTHTFEYAVMPHEGDWAAAAVHHVAERFNVEPIVGAAGPGAGELPTRLSLLEVQGDGLQLNALKQGEWDESVIVRVSNPTNEDVHGGVALHAAVVKAEVVNLIETDIQAELPVEGNRIAVTVPAKKIVTIRLHMAK